MSESSLASAEGRARLYVCIAGSGAPIRLLVNLPCRNMVLRWQLKTRFWKAGCDEDRLPDCVSQRTDIAPGMRSIRVHGGLFIPMTLSRRTGGAHCRECCTGHAGAQLRLAHDRLGFRMSHPSNAGIKAPNPGLTLLQLTYTYLPRGAHPTQRKIPCFRPSPSSCSCCGCSA